MKIKYKLLILIILAGGFGSRMRNLTKNKHKAMLKIGNFPILAHLYTQLRLSFIKKIILCTGYKSNGIKSYSKKKIKDDSDKILRLIKNKKTLPMASSRNFSSLYVSWPRSAKRLVFGLSFSWPGPRKQSLLYRIVSWPWPPGVR